MKNFKKLVIVASICATPIISAYSAYDRNEPSYSSPDSRASNNQKTNYQESTTQSTWSSWMGKSDNKSNVPDEAITMTVLDNLRNTPYLSYSAKNIQVMTKDGKVTLKGKVANKNEKNLVEYIVKNIEGVKSVSNDLSTEK